MSVAHYKAAQPGRKPWYKRISWTWNRVNEAPPIPPGVAWDWHRRPLWGHYDNGFNVFGPYERPIVDATGGGQLYSRQLSPLHPDMVFQQAFTPVSIAADGSELTGQFTVLPLVNVTTPGSNEIVSISQQNGVTNISLPNTNAQALGG